MKRFGDLTRVTCLVSHESAVTPIIFVLYSKLIVNSWLTLWLLKKVSHILEKDTRYL